MSSKRNRRGRGSRHQARGEHAPDLQTLFFGETKQTDIKTLQMCRQVQRRLDIALGGELQDPVLQGLWVNAVRPEPGGRSLLVQVIVNEASRVAQVRTHLDAARGLLRSEIAGALHRKRTPHLHFVVMPVEALTPPQEVDDELD